MKVTIKVEGIRPKANVFYSNVTRTDMEPFTVIDIADVQCTGRLAANMLRAVADEIDGGAAA